MKLRSKLSAIDEASRNALSPQALATFERSFEELREGGILARARRVGEVAPDFILPTTTGEEVELIESCTRNPIVLNFWRGDW